MALASTSFMTAVEIIGTTDHAKVDMSDVLSAIWQSSTGVGGHIKIKGTAKNIEHKWSEDALNAVYVTAKMPGSVTLSIKSPAASSNVARILRTGAILYPETGDMRVRITTTPVTGSNVVTMYGSTAFTAVAASTKFYVTAMPKSDLDAGSEDISKARTVRKNFSEVFERAVRIEESRKHVSVYAVSDDLQHQIKLRTMEAKRELEMAVLHGYAKALASNTYAASSELRTMAGAIQLIRDTNLDSTNEDSNVVNASSAALSENLINSLAFKIWDKGGLDEESDCAIFVGAYQQRVISRMERDIRRVEQGEKKLGYYKNVFLTELGPELPIVLVRWLQKDKLLIIDRNRWFLTPLGTDTWHLEKLAKTGRNEHWQLSGQYTLTMRNACEAHGLIHTLATS